MLSSEIGRESNSHSTRYNMNARTPRRILVSRHITSYGNNPQKLIIIIKN